MVFRVIYLIFFFFFPFFSYCCPLYPVQNDCVKHAPAATSPFHMPVQVQSPTVGRHFAASISHTEVQIYISLPLSDL